MVARYKGSLAVKKVIVIGGGSGGLAAAQRAAEKLKREANCAKARKNLQDIMNAAFLYKKSNDPLNPIVYSDEERKDITTKAKKAVQDWCK